MLQVHDLRTEYLRDPMGLDAARPRFSWKLESDRKDVVQLTWRIVAFSKDAILWDSGIVPSRESQRLRYGGPELNSRQQVSWKVAVTAVDDSGDIAAAECGPAHFEMGLLSPQDWQAQWIEPETDVDAEARKPAPYLRREFQILSGLRRARLYQTAHGLYEFWINGQMGTDALFKPGLTSYYARIQYQAVDVTGLLHEGVNAWAVMLGDGWWRGAPIPNNFGYKLHYFGQLELEYQDGSTQVIGTDKQFKTSTGGLLASNMKTGEIYDAALEPGDWKLPGFDDRTWSNVHLTTEHADAALIASRSVPVREKERFEAQPFRDKKDRLVLDFGQNIAGYVQVKLRGCRRGQEIHLIHGEMLEDGCFSIANVHPNPLEQHDFQCVTYRCAGLPVEEYTPQFAIFGFQYVLVEGYDGEIQPGDLTAIAVYSDLEETGDFTCSNPLINKLVQNSRWSQKGNFMDVAVDCPTRERNTWTGDSQVYVRTACDFMNIYPFFEKWLQDQTIEQFASGKLGITFPSTSSVHNPVELPGMQRRNPLAALAGPAGDGNLAEDSTGWGDAAVWNPYMLYLCYGDRQILENQFETARRWVERMLTCAREHNPLYEAQPQYHTFTDGELDADYIYDTRFHFGEWNEPIAKTAGGQNLAEALARMARQGNPAVATAYMCRSAANVAHMAEILGKEAEHQKYQCIARRIKKGYSQYLIGEDGVIEPGHQAAYVRALAFDLCSEEKRPLVAAQLVKEIEANGFRLNTGFLSTPFLLMVLADIGQADLAFRLLEQTAHPGWLFSVTHGATTIPESWDGFTAHKDSLNHACFGAVCDFLFSRVAGIQPRFDLPGYQEFDLCPLVGGSLNHARAVYQSLYGTIISGWERTDTGLAYYCTIPANCSAHLSLPDGTRRRLGSGSYRFEI